MLPRIMLHSVILDNRTLRAKTYLASNIGVYQGSCIVLGGRKLKFCTLESKKKPVGDEPLKSSPVVQVLTPNKKGVRNFAISHLEREGNLKRFFVRLGPLTNLEDTHTMTEIQLQLLQN